MSDSKYTSDSFDAASAEEQSHQLKLSIDLLSVRNCSISANLFAAYQLKLKEVHTFQSNPPTPVGTGTQDRELKNCFASYTFAATKAQLFSMLNDNDLAVRLIH